ncbi:replicative DNA helicase [Nitzschia inconspicua]|uniref:DNA helicase n=1 Tax=Nitzschia inconspicua TaxID=303405 RepID=A0A9K3LML3_9STRA|nr:replicative DNA helicase [Nitzschia inconspicua]
MSLLIRNPPPLTDRQRKDLCRLWKVQNREFQDVRVEDRQLTSELPLELTNHDCLHKITRLHHFVLKTLKMYLGDTTAVDDERDRESSSTTRATIFGTLSSLEPFLTLFVENNKTLRLRSGRRVLTINYEQFMSELNLFEFGKNISQGDPQVKQCFGAFLYHHPVLGTMVLNATLALAVVTLWRSMNERLFQSPQQNENDSLTEPNNPGHSRDSAVSMSKVNSFLDSCQLIVRLIHVTPQVAMADVKTGLVNKFISVKGHVVKARPRRLRVATADFVCPKCAAILCHEFDKGKFSVPTRCSSKECKSKTFTLMRSTARYTNVQELRLQESQEESTSHAGRTPRQLEVELTHDLIDTCRPGDIVLVACHVDAVNSAVAAGRAGKRAKETSTYKIFLQAHSIMTLSETNQQSGNNKSSSTEGLQITYTQQQLENITQLCHADHRYFGGPERRAFPFDLLVRSLCPSIIGHHTVKAGILLCLLGGTPPASQQMDRGSTIRNNSHILIVGDPGMGKSQMLLAATQLAARSVYVGGNTASTTGLTVTLTKEEGGETGIEAGALVLADQGVACIDELDKCKHLEGLLEAMEQQCVSIAKAGVVASLPARCSIIAAANPKHGSYNMSKSVAENLNMARPILSRFDLVFILRDRADEEQDRMVSSNIMNLYRKNGGGTGMGMLAAGDQAGNEMLLLENENAPESTEDQSEEPRFPLEKRLAWVASFNEPLPASLVRDYIAYAREYCKPKLTKEAAIVLKRYFMELRYPSNVKSNRYESIPITTRQLEALIRLAQARAKACLREFVLKEDALDVVELLKKSVEQVHTDEHGLVDRHRIGAGGLSNRKMRLEFEKHLREVVGGGECTYQDLVRLSSRFDCPYSMLEPLIDGMRSDGFLLKKPNGKFSITMM